MATTSAWASPRRSRRSSGSTSATRSACSWCTATATWPRWSARAARSACSHRQGLLLPSAPMPRARTTRRRRAPRAAACALGAALIASAHGCGGSHGAQGSDKATQELSFEQLPDTTGLSTGTAILESFEPSRMSNGAVRVTGRIRLPDGTKLQIVIKAPGGRVSVAMAHVYVQGERFDTPPLLGDRGPLPRGDYQFELLGHFDTDWQSREVLRAMNGGMALRGPGITRARDGSAA